MLCYIEFLSFREDNFVALFPEVKPLDLGSFMYLDYDALFSIIAALMI